MSGVCQAQVQDVPVSCGQIYPKSPEICFGWTCTKGTSAASYGAEHLVELQHEGPGSAPAAQT